MNEENIKTVITYLKKINTPQEIINGCQKSFEDLELTTEIIIATESILDTCQKIIEGINSFKQKKPKSSNMKNDPNLKRINENSKIIKKIIKEKTKNLEYAKLQNQAAAILTIKYISKLEKFERLYKNIISKIEEIDFSKSQDNEEVQKMLQDYKALTILNYINKASYDIIKEKQTASIMEIIKAEQTIKEAKIVKN